jgi:putative glutamine amidotransferase
VSQNGGIRQDRAMQPDVRPLLAVVDVSDAGRDDPAFHDVLGDLTARTIAAAEDVGFRVRRLAAEQLGEREVLARVADADAVVLMGGEDVGPEHYDGAARYPEQGQHFAEADRAQIALVRRVVAEAVPTLGICRGMQIVNVALGGDLVQHLGDAGHVRPGVPDEAMVDHDVVLDPTARMAAVLGVGSPTDGSAVLAVRSSHHQAVGRVAPDLAVVATAGDGTVEAVEHRTAPLWAVQWHPEDADAPSDVLRALLAAMLPSRVVG